MYYKKKGSKQNCEKFQLKAIGMKLPENDPLIIHVIKEFVRKRKKSRRGLRRRRKQVNSQKEREKK